MGTVLVLLAGCASSQTSGGSAIDGKVDQLAGLVSEKPTPQQEAEMERLLKSLEADASSPAGRKTVYESLGRKAKEVRDIKRLAILECMQDPDFAPDPETTRLVNEFAEASSQAESSTGNKSAQESWTAKAKKAEAGLRERARTADGKRAVLEAIDVEVEYLEVKHKLEDHGFLKSMADRLKELKKSLP